MPRMMFHYELPDGGVHDMVTMNMNGELKFEPPVWEQRYRATLLILEDKRWSEHMRKIVEFGCCEMKLLRFMYRIETYEHIMQVDIDENTLIMHQSRARPLTADYLKKRLRPLRIEIFRGSIADSVENVRNMDVVICLEIIEHLEKDVLDKVPQNIFGFIQPKLAIFSTPNREYNVLFNGLNANGFRIDDHKFEWTRSEFRDWAINICKNYPNYSVAFIGLGSPPPAHRKIGYVTQMAIFVRNDIIYRPLKTPILTNVPADLREEVQYKEIYAVDFPYNVDDRTTKQKIIDFANNYINRTYNAENYYNSERCIYQLPMKYITEYALSLNATKEDVVSILQELKFNVENDFIILTEEYIEENYHGRSHLYPEEDDEAFLEYEPYHYDEEYDGNSRQNVSNDNDNIEPEECWD